MNTVVMPAMPCFTIVFIFNPFKCVTPRDLILSLYNLGVIAKQVYFSCCNSTFAILRFPT